MKVFIKHQGTADCRIVFQLAREKMEVVREYFRKEGQGKNVQLRFVNGASVYSKGCGWYAIYGDGFRVDAALEAMRHIKTALIRGKKPESREEKNVPRENIFSDVRPRVRVRYERNARGFKVPVMKDYGTMARVFYEDSMRKQEEMLQREVASRESLVVGLSKLAEKFGKSINFNGV